MRLWGWFPYQPSWIGWLGIFSTKKQKTLCTTLGDCIPISIGHAHVELESWREPKQNDVRRVMHIQHATGQTDHPTDCTHRLGGGDSHEHHVGILNVSALQNITETAVIRIIITNNDGE